MHRNSGFLSIFLALAICFRVVVSTMKTEELTVETEAVRSQREIDCAKKVDECLRGKLRNGEVSGHNEEESQKTMASCAEKHKCSLSKQRLCFSFRFEKTRQPWMEQKCSKWGESIPAYEELPDYEII